MDSLVASINNLLEFPIDFEGQRKANNLLVCGLVVSVVISLLAAVLANSIFALVYVFAASVFATAAIVVPAWPCYNKHPHSFLRVEYRI